MSNNECGNSRTFSRFMVWWAATMMMAAPGASAAAAQSRVVVTHLDGETTAGLWSGIADEGVTILVSGQPSQVALANVGEMRFVDRPVQTTPQKSGAPASSAAVYTVGGGFFFGELIDSGIGDTNDAVKNVADGAVVVDVPRRGRWTIPFQHLVALRLAAPQAAPAAAAIFDAVLADRPAAEDTLITRSAEGPKSARGILESLGRDAGTFSFGGRSRSFQTENVYGIVFAAGAGGAAGGSGGGHGPPGPAGRGAAPPVRLELTDGSAWPGRVRGADGDAIEFEPAFGGRMSVTVDEVVRLDCGSDRVVFLSDMTAASETFKGVLHRVWPAGRDRSAGGAALTLDGRSFAKGLGIHAHGELTYDLDAGFETLAAVIGIDDAVRPRGSVVFRVLGDGRPLYDSGLMTGRDAGRTLRVPVSGVNTLTLMVTDGDGLDLADHADWAEARVIRPVPGAGP